MKLFIGLIIAFLALIYIYTFIKIRKRRQKNTDAVDNYRKQYLQRKSLSETSNYKDSNRDSNYEAYITKYNSRLDYIEKDQY